VHTREMTVRTLSLFFRNALTPSSAQTAVSESSRVLGKLFKRMVVESEPVEPTGPTPSVDIELEEDWLYTLPIPGFPTVDPILRGTGSVTLPESATLSKLEVVLEGLCEAYGGEGHEYEVSVTLKAAMEEDLVDELVKPGKYPYVLEMR
jgi:hypothetical protein